MTKNIRVVIVDDHPLFRDGVARSLHENGGFEVLAEGGTAEEAVRLARELKPDIVLLDISMPGNGLTAVAELAESLPDVAIVMLTVSEGSDDIMTALKSGAKGYVLKGVGSAALVEIIAGIARGESYVSPTLAARLLTELDPGSGPNDPLADLSRREREILRLVANGQSNKEVARHLGLQEKTIKHHMTRILGKLRARNRTEAALKWREAEGRRRRRSTV